MLARGDVAYIVTIPADFERKLVRGERPQILVEADATDPAATAGGIGALPTIVRAQSPKRRRGALCRQQPGSAAGRCRSSTASTIRKASPRYNIVPGLLGVILTMTTILMTALALTREVERGTIENLMAMPARPLEIMIGKIVPYIGFGFVQVAVILIAAKLLFAVPMEGSLIAAAGGHAPLHRRQRHARLHVLDGRANQMQAMQMTFFFFLPSILLSGFMFPFRGMPGWAQVIGEAIPLTHFLRIVRGVMLKGGGFAEVWPNVWPLALFWLAVATIALVRYRRTLD